jgi:hypothetical protein
MKRALLFGLVFWVACGSGEQRAREEIEKESARAAQNKPPPEPVKEIKGVPDPVKPKKEEAPPDPEPTTPAEVDTARKKAMIDGRDKDVVKYCEMAKPTDKTDPQVLTGCTLAACRLKDEVRAHAWSAALAASTAKGAKPLMDQAKKVCIGNNISL